jgi:primosomal protein N' (replication factor Y) (superfamily II helicase)
LLGPAPLFRLKDRHRFMVLMKMPSVAEATDGFGEGPLDAGAIGRAVQAAAADRSLRGVSFAVDVDPQ